MWLIIRDHDLRVPTSHRQQVHDLRQIGLRTLTNLEQAEYKSEAAHLVNDRAVPITANLVVLSSRPQ